MWFPTGCELVTVVLLLFIFMLQHFLLISNFIFLLISYSRTRHEAVNLMKRVVEKFIKMKHKINKEHKFALVLLTDTAHWVCLLVINNFT